MIRLFHRHQWGDWRRWYPPAYVRQCQTCKKIEFIDMEEA